MAADRKTRTEPQDPAAPADQSSLERGRHHFGRRAWAEAREALLLASQEGEIGLDDLERLALSTGLSGRDDEFVGRFEHLYQACLKEGLTDRAAQTAFWIGFRLGAMGELGRASAWLSRAERLIEGGAGPSVVSGYLLLPLIRRHMMGGDYDAALRAAAEAAAIGDRFADANLSVFARVLHGRVFMQMGKVDAGLPLIDEAMLVVMSGKLSPVVTGLVYCIGIESCRRIYALDRAREWTSALAHWCDEQPQLVTFANSCRVHRAELLQLGGDWRAATEEAERATVRLWGRDPDALGDALYQQGEVQRLRGDVARAEDTYRKASELGRDPQPGLALLRLSQGRGDIAAGAIRRVLAATKSWIDRLRFLPAAVEIFLGAGDFEEARLSCEELAALADICATAGLAALAAHARGQLQLAAGDAEGALVSLRRALEVGQHLGVPYNAAKTRLVLAKACRALGDDDSASLELEAARAAFERLGAALDVAATSVLAQRTSGAPVHGLTGRELQVLRLVAAGKTNKVVASELCLSEKTVDRHVSNIFVKLDVSSRTAATAYAYENGLI